MGRKNTKRIFLCVAILATACTTADNQNFIDLAKEIYAIEKAEKPIEVKPEPSITPTPTPTPRPTPIPTPEPISTPEPTRPSKPLMCPDSGKKIQGHHGPDDVCTIGSEKGGCSVLKFTGGRGGLECLKSNTTGELKCGLPWNFDCELASEVKVCGPKSCVSAKMKQSAWVNWDSTPSGKMCTQWHRWGESPEAVFRKTGEPVRLVVGKCEVEWCKKQWTKEKRCS